MWFCSAVRNPDTGVTSARARQHPISNRCEHSTAPARPCRPAQMGAGVLGALRQEGARARAPGAGDWRGYIGQGFRPRRPLSKVTGGLTWVEPKTKGRGSALSGSVLPFNPRPCACPATRRNSFLLRACFRALPTVGSQQLTPAWLMAIGAVGQPVGCHCRAQAPAEPLQLRLFWSCFPPHLL